MFLFLFICLFAELCISALLLNYLGSAIMGLLSLKIFERIVILAQIRLDCVKSVQFVCNFTSLQIINKQL